MKTLLLALIAFGNLIAGDPPAYLPIVSHGACPYSGKSFRVYKDTLNYDNYHWDDDQGLHDGDVNKVDSSHFYHTNKLIYNFGDSIPSEFATKKFRKRLLPYIYRAIALDSTHSTRWNEDSCISSIALQAQYEFEGAPDFVVLKYAIIGEDPMSYRWEEFNEEEQGPIIFVGVIRSSNRFYVLTDGYGERLEDNFNQLVNENPGAITLSPYCKSCLLLSIRYGCSNLVLPSSYRELVESNIFLANDDSSNHARTIQSPYLARISSEEFFPAWLKAQLAKWHRDSLVISDFDYLPRNLESPAKFKDSMSFAVEERQISGGGVNISLPIYSGNVGELARWSLSFSAAGTIDKMWYENGPISLTSRSTCQSDIDPKWAERSPLYRINNTYFTPETRLIQDSIIVLPDKLIGEHIIFEDPPYAYDVKWSELKGLIDEDLKKGPSDFLDVKYQQLENEIKSKGYCNISLESSSDWYREIYQFITPLTVSGKTALREMNSSQHITKLVLRNHYQIRSGVKTTIGRELLLLNFRRIMYDGYWFGLEESRD